MGAFYRNEQALVFRAAQGRKPEAEQVSQDLALVESGESLSSCVQLALMTFSCWILRILIAGVVLASALGKSLDLAGFVSVLATYDAVPRDWLWPLAWSVIGVEWALALWLLSGWNLGTGALACVGLNLGYASWMTISLLRGLDIPNCGCFGRFFPQPLSWYSPLEDLVLVVMSYALWRCARKTRRIQ